MKLSCSSVQLFLDCPFRWKLRNLENIPEPENKAQARGKLIHSVCQDWIMTKKEPILIPENQKMLEQFKKMITTKEMKKVKDVEKNFILSFGGGNLIITGKIDIVYQGGIIEIKTSARGLSENEIKNNIQFPIYSMAYKKIYKKGGDVILCILGAKPEKYKIKITKEWEREALDKFYYVQEAIDRNEFPQVNSWRCKYCYYREGFCMKGIEEAI